MTKALSLQYNQMYLQAYPQIQVGNYETDPLIDSPDDDRLGITLLIRPSEVMKKQISGILEEFRKIEPHQYYYPESDMHITVMSIISCYSGFDLSSIDVSKYVDIIQDCLADINPFNISFDGLTASSSCIMLQGFPVDDTLSIIRDRLREAFKSSDLENSLDKRYAIQTAHSTVIRFQEPMIDHNHLALLLHKMRETMLGSFTVESMELVFNDWYQKAERVKTLHQFSLTKQPQEQ